MHLPRTLYLLVILLSMIAPLLAQRAFSPAVAYASGGYLPSLAVADLNGDGTPDIVVANYGGTLGVLLGNGDGTFRAVQPVGSTEDNEYVTVGDVNGDGIPDVIVATGASSSVRLFLGKGDGTFPTELTYGSGGYLAQEVVIADVNGDDRPDLVVVNSCISTSNCANGTATVLLNSGGGGFQTATAYSSGGYYPTSVAAADINGDGKPDLIVGNACVANNADCYSFIPGLPSTVAILLGEGDGTFQSAVTYETGPYYTLSVQVADVNGDGKPDVVVAKGGSSTVEVLLGKGDGTLQPFVGYRSGGYYTTAVTIADINGDSKPDLIVANCAFKEKDGCNA